MCPCGIIVLLAELFKTESKSQVYACLHEFFRIHPHVMEKLGKRGYSKEAIYLNQTNVVNISRFAVYTSIMHVLLTTKVCICSFYSRVHMLWWWLSPAKVCPTQEQKRCDTHCNKAIQHWDCCWQASHGRTHRQVVHGKLWRLPLQGAGQSMSLYPHSNNMNWQWLTSSTAVIIKVCSICALPFLSVHCYRLIQRHVSNVSLGCPATPELLEECRGVPFCFSYYTCVTFTTLEKRQNCREVISCDRQSVVCSGICSCVFSWLFTIVHCVWLLSRYYTSSQFCGLQRASGTWDQGYPDLILGHTSGMSWVIPGHLGPGILGHSYLPTQGYPGKSWLIPGHLGPGILGHSYLPTQGYPRKSWVIPGPMDLGSWDIATCQPRDILSYPRISWTWDQCSTTWAMATGVTASLHNSQYHSVCAVTTPLEID